MEWLFLTLLAGLRVQTTRAHAWEPMGGVRPRRDVTSVCSRTLLRILLLLFIDIDEQAEPRRMWLPQISHKHASLRKRGDSVEWRCFSINTKAQWLQHARPVYR